MASLKLVFAFAFLVFHSSASLIDGTPCEEETSLLQTKADAVSGADHRASATEANLETYYHSESIMEEEGEAADDTEVSDPPPLPPWAPVETPPLMPKPSQQSLQVATGEAPQADTKQIVQDKLDELSRQPGWPQLTLDGDPRDSAQPPTNSWMVVSLGQQFRTNGLIDQLVAAGWEKHDDGGFVILWGSPIWPVDRESAETAESVLKRSVPGQVWYAHQAGDASGWVSPGALRILVLSFNGGEAEVSDADLPKAHTALCQQIIENTGTHIHIIMLAVQEFRSTQHFSLEECKIKGFGTRPEYSEQISGKTKRGKPDVATRVQIAINEAFVADIEKLQIITQGTFGKTRQDTKSYYKFYSVVKGTKGVAIVGITFRGIPVRFMSAHLDTGGALKNLQLLGTQIKENEMEYPGITIVAGDYNTRVGYNVDGPSDKDESKTTVCSLERLKADFAVENENQFLELSRIKGPTDAPTPAATGAPTPAPPDSVVSILESAFEDCAVVRQPLPKTKDGNYIVPTYKYANSEEADTPTTFDALHEFLGSSQQDGKCLSSKMGTNTNYREMGVLDYFTVLSTRTKFTSKVLGDTSYARIPFSDHLLTSAIVEVPKTK